MWVGAMIFWIMRRNYKPPGHQGHTGSGSRAWSHLRRPDFGVGADGHRQRDRECADRVTGRSLFLVATLALLWGASFSLIKIAVETIPPLTVAALRGVGGGLLLFALMGRDGPALWRSGIPFRTYFAQAIFSCVIPWTFVAWASRTIDSSLATVLNSLSPIFVFLLTWGITRHEAVTARKFYGVVLGLAGVFTIIGVDALAGLGKHRSISRSIRSRIWSGPRSLQADGPHEFITRDGNTLIDVLDFKHQGQGLGVTVYPLGMSAGPTLGLRGTD